MSPALAELLISLVPSLLHNDMCFTPVIVCVDCRAKCAIQENLHIFQIKLLTDCFLTAGAQIGEHHRKFAYSKNKLFACSNAFCLATPQKCIKNSSAKETVSMLLCFCKKKCMHFGGHSFYTKNSADNVIYLLQQMINNLFWASFFLQKQGVNCEG